MKIASPLSSEAVLRELGERLTGARFALNLTQAALATQAGVAKRTVERLESGEAATQLSGFIRVCRVLGLLERLDGLVPEPTTSPMTQLKLQGRKRQRASNRKATTTKSKDWTWGDST